MLQFVLLAAFAVCAALCFWCRLRIGMLEGAEAREDKPAGQTKSAMLRYERGARLTAILAAVFLLACIAVGVVHKLS